MGTHRGPSSCELFWELQDVQGPENGQRIYTRELGSTQTAFLPGVIHAESKSLSVR